MNDAPQGEGALCHNTIGGEANLPVRVGDLVYYTGIAGVLWRVTGERRNDAVWYLGIRPVYSFLPKLGGMPKARELNPGDCKYGTFPVDLVELGTSYVQLGNLAQEEAKRLGQ